MLAMLTTRDLPQTLLLTVRFLLIAVAATLLACGPVAQPAPANDAPSPPAQDSGGVEPAAEPEDDTDTPTPTADPEGTGSAGSPTDSTYDPNYFPTPPPLPTRKYPNLADRDLDKLAIEADESQGPSGQSDPSPEVAVVVWTNTNPDNEITENLVTWLKAQGIPADYIAVGGRTEGYGDGSFIYTTVPTHLLGPLSQREGVLQIVNQTGGPSTSPPTR